MAWLGIMQTRPARNLLEAKPIGAASAHGNMDAGFVTGVLNPIAIQFYMAFLAQSIEPTAPQLPQFMILMVTSTLVVALLLGGGAPSGRKGERQPSRIESAKKNRLRRRLMPAWRKRTHGSHTQSALGSSRRSPQTKPKRF